MTDIPDHVHLVGSIGLDTVEEVFRTAGALLGRRLRRVPDGEPGGRRLWISWQYPLLRANPFLKQDATPLPPGGVGFPRLGLGDGVSGGDVRFGELGYAREARASYLDFVAARGRGELPADARFQVCLPTPLAVIMAFCRQPDAEAIEPAYEAAMLREVDAVCRAIPHRDLALQWDVCLEMIAWDGQLGGRYSPPSVTNETVLARLARISRPVQADVELGIHLCYGDLDGRHFVEPKDAGKMVEFANAIAGAIAHPLAYMHMPVPIARSDDAFFAPLRGLTLAPGTELYLGLVHGDGADATRRRIAAAQKAVADFGIATECGMARARTPAVVTNLLEIHAAASHEPAAR
jgi:hypothetical protein